MFSALQEYNPFYFLVKSGKIPELKTGSVVSVSSPRPKQGVQFPPVNVVDITVRFDEEQVVFKDVEASKSITPYGNNGVVISESREAMAGEVDAMLRSSQLILDSIDYHKGVVASCDGILKGLNPQYAKNKENEERLAGMEDKITALGKNMEEMMTIVRSLSTKTRKE